MLQRFFYILFGLVIGGFAIVLVLLPKSPSATSGAAHDAVTADVVGPSFVIDSALVFDGQSFRDDTDIVVVDGVIEAVGHALQAPDALPRIDASGALVLPGLIDAHTHTWGSAREDALRFGVTTMLDMFTAPAALADAAEDPDVPAQPARAALFSAGMLATVAGGHGTQFGVPIETIDDDTDIDAWVAARIREGSDYIKLVYMPGNPVFPSLDLAQARAVIDAAHARKLLAVAHINTAADAAAMVDAGIDGLVHVFADAPVSDALLARMREERVFVVPTLAVIAVVSGAAPGPTLVADSNVAPFLTKSQQSNLAADFGGAIPGFDLQTALDNVRRMHEAGIVILAGSDAPNPGTTHGATLHQELALLVRAGLDVEAALAAATSHAADAFMLRRRGRLAPGMPADLLLVDADARSDIAATRRLREIRRNGLRVERALAVSAAGQASTRTFPALLGDFADGAIAPDGFAWSPTSDEMMGGASTAALAAAPDAALRIETSVRSQFPFPWAGAYLGVVPNGASASLARYERVTFRVRGTPGRYRLMAFPSDAAGAPPTAEFAVTSDWQDVEIALATLGTFDRSRITGLAWVTPMAPGDYAFSIDDIRLQ